MGFTAMDVIATLIFNILQFSYAMADIRYCNVTALETCKGEHELCSQSSNKCICEDGYTMYEDKCVIPDEVDSTHNTTAALVTIFTLALLICGLVLVVRKYDLIEYVRQKINQRRNNDIMYEDVMIGQDDPPLSP